MKPDELHQIHSLIVEGDIAGTQELAERALEEGVEPQALINSYLVPAMEEVGNRFESGEIFVPEMLVSARAAGTILKLTEPHLDQDGSQALGTVALGTVKGDPHDIGKNIVGMMLRSAGFKIIDLGTDVGPEQFVRAIAEQGADMVGMSALLTTTMGSMRATLEAINEAGLRDGVKVIIGGAPITDAFAQEIGADGYAQDAAAAVRLAKSLA